MNKDTSVSAWYDQVQEEIFCCSGGVYFLNNCFQIHGRDEREVAGITEAPSRLNFIVHQLDHLRSHVRICCLSLNLKNAHLVIQMQVAFTCHANKTMHL